TKRTKCEGWSRSGRLAIRGGTHRVMTMSFWKIPMATSSVWSRFPAGRSVGSPARARTMVEGASCDAFRSREVGMPTRQAARRLVKKTGPTRRAGAARPARPESIDEYLAAVPVDKRRALAKLRTQIRAAPPGATEGISYGVPTFKLEGRLLVSFGAAVAHCSLYGVNGTDATGAQLTEL